MVVKKNDFYFCIIYMLLFSQRLWGISFITNRGCNFVMGK